jgi:HK97 family phage portal protein
VTVLARRAQRQMQQQRGWPIGQGGWGGWIGDPAAIPPPSAYNSSTAGVTVSERTVLSLMVVSSCIRILGDTSAGLEPHVYRMVGNRRSPEDKEVDPPDVIVDPYADMDREDGDFRRVASLGLNGNMITHVVDRAGGKGLGNPDVVEVVNPAIMKVEESEGRKVYKVGAVGREIPASDIIHTPWIALGGGLVGLNPIEIGVHGFGNALAAAEYSDRFYPQAMHPSGILSIEKPLRPEDSKRVQDELFTKHGGLAQAHTPIVLDAAAKWQQISINPETAQLLQSRSFSRGEITGFYGVPGFLVGDTPDQGGVWGKGLQEIIMGFAVFALKGYTGRLDRADTHLLPAGYYVVRRVKELFETNDQMRGQFVSMLRQASVLSPNAGLELLGLPKSDEEGADSIFAPVASAHADFLASPEGGAESALPGSINAPGTPTGKPNADGGPTS